MKNNLIIIISFVVSIILIFLLNGLSVAPILLFIVGSLIILIKYKITVGSIMIFLLFTVSGLERYLLENFKISNLEYLLFSILVLLQIISKNRIKINKVYLKVLVMFLLFFSIFMVTGSINSNSSNLLNFLSNFFNNILILIAGILLIHSSGKNQYIHFTLILMIFISLTGINEWLINSKQFYFSNYFYRSHGLVGNPNQQGQLLVLTSIPIIWSIIKKTLPILLNVLFIGINGFALVLTQSRGSMVTYFVILLMFLFLTNRKNKTFMKIVSIVTLIVVIPTSIYVYSSTSNSIFWNRIINGGESGYSNERLDALMVGLKSIDVIGIGIGNSSINDTNLSSHNFYVHVLSENGLVFAPVFVALVITMIYLFFYITTISIRTAKIHIGNYIILAILFIGFFTHNVFYHSIYYFMIPLITCEIPNIRKSFNEK